MSPINSQKLFRRPSFFSFSSHTFSWAHVNPRSFFFKLSHTIVYSIFSQGLALSLGHLFSCLNVIKVAK